jgi:hypothetical protein
MEPVLSPQENSGPFEAKRGRNALMPTEGPHNHVS